MIRNKKNYCPYLYDFTVFLTLFGCDELLRFEFNNTKNAIIK